MKKIIIVLITCILFSNAKANTDSLNFISDSNNFVEIVDSNVIRRKRSCLKNYTK